MAYQALAVPSARSPLPPVCWRLANMAKVFLSPLPPVWMSKVALALMFKTCKSQVSPDQVELAGLTWQCSRQLWHSFLTWISAQIDVGALVGHLIIIHWAADETPTRLTLADTLRELNVALEDEVRPVKKAGAPTSSPSRLNQNKEKAPRTVKLLQQQCTIAVVVSGTLTCGKPVILDGKLVCPPYGMASTNAECMSVGFQRTTDLAIMKQMVTRFKFIVRPTSLDRAGGCVRLVKNQCVLFPLARSLPAPCYVHCSHTAARKACSLQDSDISGIFAYIDSFDNAGEIGRFRDIFEEEIARSAEDVDVDSSVKNAMLEALLPDSSVKNVHRRHVLSGFTFKKNMALSLTRRRSRRW